VSSESGVNSTFNKNSRFVTLLSSPSNSSLGGDSAHASGTEEQVLQAIKRKQGPKAKAKAPKIAKEKLYQEVSVKNAPISFKVEGQKHKED